MKLGSLKSKSSKDGDLVVVSKDNKKAANAQSIAPNLRTALENWKDTEPKLKKLYDNLNKGSHSDIIDVNEVDFHSPMPRTFQWADGSAFIHHIKLVRKSRNAPLPENLFTVPLMYQGCGDSFLAPRENIPLSDESYGLDFESEVGVILDDVPMGVSAEKAESYIRLFVIINDVSMRGLIPEELKAGFGFFHGKPSTSFAPFAITPDELGEYWKDGRIQLPLHTELNGEFFGKPDAKEMHFSFGELIAHAAKTRHLTAGTIIGSGTVSNEDPNMGSSCLSEKRMIEKIETGEIKTPFLKFGDRVKIWMEDESGNNIFGTIEQTVEKYEHKG